MTPGTPTLTLYLAEIQTRDWPTLVRYYVEILGLSIVLDDPARQYALLAAGTGLVAIKGKPDLRLAGGSIPSLVRLVFETDNIDIEVQRLSEAGVSVGRVEENPEGYRAVRLHDPEGTPITIFAWKPGNHAQ